MPTFLSDEVFICMLKHLKKFDICMIGRPAWFFTWNNNINDLTNQPNKKADTKSLDTYKREPLGRGTNDKLWANVLISACSNFIKWKSKMVVYRNQPVTCAEIPSQFQDGLMCQRLLNFCQLKWITCIYISLTFLPSHWFSFSDQLSCLKPL